MFSIDLTCPHCGKECDFQVHQPTEYRSQEKIKTGQVRTRQMQVSSRMITPNEKVKAYATSSCQKCNAPVLIWFEASYESLKKMGDSSQSYRWVYSNDNSLKILGTYPELKKTLDSPYWPEKLRNIFSELQEDVEAGRMPERIVSGCRSVMEVALKELKCGKENTNILKRIDAARDSGLITESLKNWGHRVRLDGNQAIHELEATKEEAEEAIAFIKLFLEIAFDVPKRIPDKADEV